MNSHQWTFRRNYWLSCRSFSRRSLAQELWDNCLFYYWFWNKINLLKILSIGWGAPLTTPSDNTELACRLALSIRLAQPPVIALHHLIRVFSKWVIAAGWHVLSFRRKKWSTFKWMLDLISQDGLGDLPNRNKSLSSIWFKSIVLHQRSVFSLATWPEKPVSWLCKACMDPRAIGVSLTNTTHHRLVSRKFHSITCSWSFHPSNYPEDGRLWFSACFT